MGYRKQLERTKPLLLRDAFSEVSVKKQYIKLIYLTYGTPYIHTPTGLVERGVRTLKENLLTNIKAGVQFGKPLDMSLDEKTKKAAFELHYGRKPNTEISNLLNLDETEKLTKHSFQPNQMPYRYFPSVELAVCLTSCP